MQTSSHVRKHSTPAERDRILRAYQRGQLTQKEFAAQTGIGVSTLQAWLRKGALTRDQGGSGFLQAPNLLSASPPPPAYRIQWPGGLSLELHCGFAVEELALLLEALQTL